MLPPDDAHLLSSDKVNALLFSEPGGALATLVDELLRVEPIRAFAFATEAEFALVRMTRNSRTPFVLLL